MKGYLIAGLRSALFLQVIAGSCDAITSTHPLIPDPA
jgi:hypothetical protein